MLQGFKFCRVLKFLDRSIYRFHFLNCWFQLFCHCNTGLSCSWHTRGLCSHDPKWLLSMCLEPMRRSSRRSMMQQHFDCRLGGNMIVHVKHVQSAIVSWHDASKLKYCAPCVEIYFGSLCNRNLPGSANQIWNISRRSCDFLSHEANKQKGISLAWSKNGGPETALGGSTRKFFKLYFVGNTVC